MKRFYFALLILLASLATIAQEITVEGVVITADDEVTLPGATVLEKGTMNGTTTDIDGYYRITVPADAILQFSFVGMQSQEIPVQSRTKIDVALLTESFGLDEIVVIGFGTVKKKDVTGSVSVLDSKTINELNPVRPEQALQGTATGVNVTSQSGSPGAGLNIRIRGIATNGDASPLVIIDGYQGDLSLLNPNDIETITVLKDAQAAIYGTIGANGVILITTKGGKKNTPTSVSLNSNFGWQQTTRELDLLNASEYAVLLNESYAANGQPLPYPDISGLGTGTDWQGELFEMAPIYDNNFRIAGGSEKTVYSFSASDVRQKGILGRDKAQYSRTTAGLNLGTDFTKWLNFTTTLYYTHLERTSFNDFGLGSVLFNAVNMPSTVPVYDENGDYFLAPANLGIEIINPLAQIANTYNDYYLNKFNGNLSLEAKFAKHFTATGRFGFNSTNDFSKSFSPIVDYGGKVFDVTRSSVTQSRNNYNDFTSDLFVTYDNYFRDDHHLIVTLGGSIFKTWGNNLSATGYDIPNNSWDFADISLANGLPTSKNVGSFTYDQRRASGFGRVQYDYKGKYLASFMLRRDYSSKFGPENSSAWFPSATLGWVISDEGFMSDAKNVDLLKLRLSYGLLGSDRIGDFQYISQLSGEGVYVFNGELAYGVAVGAVPNDEIKWEQSEHFDVGADMKFFEDKLDFTADYFIRTTTNLLISNVPVSGSLGVGAPGASGPTINAGTVRNSGFEMAVGTRGSKTENFSYRINLNFTYLKNEVTEVNNGTGFVEGGGFGVGQPLPSRMEVGLPIGYFYGYETDGVFQSQEEVDAHPSQAELGAEASPGDIRYKDLNGDGVINLDDRTNIGDPIPDYTLGLNINLSFYDFDFVAYAYASFGSQMVRNYERAQPNVNRLSYTLDRWRGPGTSDEVPRVTTAATTNTVFSDFYVEDNSYLRLQRISLGYTIPVEITQKAKIQKVRFYVAADNLFTLTKYMGFDPAASSGVPIGSGFDAGFYPAARVYWFGLNLNI